MPSEGLIRTRQIVGNSAGPQLLITGGVHGDEFEPMAAVRRLMTMLSPLDISGTVTLAPVVNEAAFQRGHRFAEDGLDLARTCPGSPEGSVTQRTAHALSELIRQADYFIDLHTGGTKMSVLPMSGYVLHPDAQVLDTQRKMAQAFNLPVIWGTDYRLEGRSLSVARDANVPAIYTEYYGGARCDPRGVEDYVNGCLNVMAVLEMLDRPAPPSKVQHVVEDPREHSGHMQICNPSPTNGFFEPSVQLGDPIEAGQPLGEVVDVLGDSSQTVLSEQTGIVLTLRTFRRVEKGDTLAVVMETKTAN